MENIRASSILFCSMLISIFFTGCLDDGVNGEVTLRVEDLFYKDFKGDDYSLRVRINVSNEYNKHLYLNTEDFKLHTYDNMTINSTEFSGKGNLEIGKNGSYLVSWNGISKEHMAESISFNARLEGGSEGVSERIQLDFEKVFMRYKLFSVNNCPDDRILFRRPESVAVGNFNEDPFLDIAVASFGVSSNEFQYPHQYPSYWVDDGLFINEQGPLELLDPSNSTRLGNGTCGRDVAVGDINLDGLDDLAICYWNSNNVEIFLQKESLTLDVEPDLILETSSQPHNLTIRDINDDGRPDIAVIGGHPRLDDTKENISIYLQRENGSFPSIPDSNFMGEEGYFAFHDIMHDGSLDLIFGSSIYSFNLTGELTEKFTFKTTKTGQIMITDIDRNGYEDIMIGSDLFLRSNEGLFSALTSYGFPGYGKPISVDVNGDGRLDIAIGRSIYFQDLNGSFSMEEDKILEFEGMIQWVEDLDGDGVMDIVTISGDDVLIYFGDRDIDNDGYLDKFDWFPMDPNSWDPRGVDPIG